MADELVEQQKLADIVKGLHGRLRKQLREANGDHRKVWESHCTDKKALEKYASAMRMLAVNHWTSQSPEGRVEWCYNTANEFFRGGGLIKLTEKQRRRHQFSSDVNACCCCFVKDDTGSWLDTEFPQSSEKPLLLDVGSCFNPFAAYEDVYPVAIDLQPADSSVYKCDFLNLQIRDLQSPRQHCCCRSGNEAKITNLSHNSSIKKEEEKSIITLAPSERSLLNSSNLSLQSSSTVNRTKVLCLDDFVEKGKEIRSLPSGFFDVVVFSLFLSYFPSPVQRWLCCSKAHRILRTNGILLIVTPDSSHQNKNSAMIKSWKAGIESLGFVRWKYKKQTHLHCMAFRKVALCHSYNRGTGSAELLYIPQDFQEEEEKFDESFSNVRSEEGDSDIMEWLSEFSDL